MGDKLKLLRKEKGVSQRDVAKAIGVTTSAYSNYEQGTREPSVELIKSLCLYFRVSADYLIGLED
ncbi:MAG: helix-turn-helix transcriptional regulator [Clostridia bacterium]|nr:helix-turn-helix transcriptional regulator [Clostridia bacterium]